MAKMVTLKFYVTNIKGFRYDKETNAMVEATLLETEKLSERAAYRKFWETFGNQSVVVDYEVSEDKREMTRTAFYEFSHPVIENETENESNEKKED